ANSIAFIGASELALNLLHQADETNALHLLAKANMALKPLTDKFQRLGNVKECLNNAHIQIQEAVSDIESFMDELEVNPQRLNEVIKRLDQLHGVARKHKIPPEQLSLHCEKLKNEAQSYALLEQTKQQLELDLTTCAKQYQRVATCLSEARQKAALKLSKEVSVTIGALGMPGGEFCVQLTPHVSNSLHASGNESAMFLVSANPGHAPGPLHKVASGGELSRISLALELLAAKFLATPCLVFDEVDVGISGKTGAIVGKALYDLSQSAQVLCITHLPQVAAMGDHHIQVIKTRLKDSTNSEIQLLTSNQRVEEIARMLGGIDITPQAKANAKQLLKRQAHTAEV
ncbi:MAG: DNA repair protein RecN, partial [Candidatus Berkiella sp.]